MVLLLIAIDPSTSSDLKSDVTIAVDAVCRSLAPGADVCAEVVSSSLCKIFRVGPHFNSQEAPVFAKLMKFTSKLTPINKAHLLSFMGGAHPRTRRLARYLAYGLLVGEEVVLEASDISSMTPVILISNGCRKTMVIYPPSRRCLNSYRPAPPQSDHSLSKSQPITKT